MKQQIKDGLGQRPIVFVGMMGCGKSAVGRLVATSLDLDFHDADTEIEKAADMTVAEIFENYGEEEFRRGEQQVIKRLLEEGPSVIALGGGAFMAADTREHVGKLGVSVWLHAEIDQLVARVLRKPGKRPLLSTGDPKQILSDLSEKRNPVYALADIKIESSRTSKNKTRDAVLDGLAEHMGVFN